MSNRRRAIRLALEGELRAVSGDQAPTLRSLTALPVMDGFAFLHAFRDRLGCGEIPVVVITARDLTSEDRRNLQEANRIVTKGGVSYSALAKDLHGIVERVTDSMPVR